MIFKYLTSIVKPCVFKLFSLRKITKSNFYHHLPTLNIANLFMQSFASPFLHPHPTHKIYAPPTQKGRNYRLYLRPFYQKIHRKGATIACFSEKYYYLCKKQINHNYYDKQRINRKSL